MSIATAMWTDLFQPAAWRLPNPSVERVGRVEGPPSPYWRPKPSKSLLGPASWRSVSTVLNPPVPIPLTLPFQRPHR